MANNGADVKPNQGVGATNTSTTTNTAENTVGTATPKQNGLAVLGKYVGVSATQTIVEYATFAILHLIGVPSQIANGIAVVCSATYNFVMNRNVTFKSSSNFTRSVALFVLLWAPRVIDADPANWPEVALAGATLAVTITAMCWVFHHFKS